MKRTRIKICCIGSVAEAEMAVAAGADALGLVGDMPSGPGIIEDELVREIAAHVPPSVTPILLTSRTTAIDIAEHCTFCGVSTVQIVGHVDPQEHDRLKMLMPQLRRLQVIHIEGEDALSLVSVYGARVDAFLLDSGRPSLKVPQLGGTGRVHDWSVSADFVRKATKPVFLAGGLNAINASEAIRMVRPFGLDLCSGVRTALRLDQGKLNAFMNAVSEVDHLF